MKFPAFNNTYRRLWRWLPLGIGLCLIWIVVLAPASVLANLASHHGLQLQGVTGSLWSGRAESARLQLAPAKGQALVFDLGALSWRLQPWALLTLSACVELESQLNAQQFKGLACRALGGKVHLSDVRINLPASFLRLMAPVEARGQVMLALDELSLSGSEIVALSGSGRIEKLALMVDREWQSFGNLNLQLATAVEPEAGFRFSLDSDDQAIQCRAQAPKISLGLAGLDMLLSAELRLSESYRLAWGNGLALLGFDDRDGAYAIEVRLP